MTVRNDETISVSIFNENKEIISKEITIPLKSRKTDLIKIISAITKTHLTQEINFYISHFPLNDSIAHTLLENNLESEKVLPIYFILTDAQKQSKIRRCAGTLIGHKKAVLSIKIFNNCKILASGSGDSSLILWDLLTSTPLKKFENIHSGWIFCLEKNLTETFMISGDSNGSIAIWNISNIRNSGKMNEECAYLEKKIFVCKESITGISFFYNNIINEKKIEKEIDEEELFSVCSSSGEIFIYKLNFEKGERIKMKEVKLYRKIKIGNSSLKGIKWLEKDKIFTYGDYKTLFLVNPFLGKIVYRIDDHFNFINHLYFTEMNSLSKKDEKLKELKTFNENFNNNNKNKEKNEKEYILVTSSDDHSAFVYHFNFPNSIPLNNENKVINITRKIRLIGHNKAIINSHISEDSKLVATASFDKTIRLWNLETGKSLFILRGHVAPVYGIKFAKDSSVLYSASKDSTVKIWGVKDGKLVKDLAGHEDEVYCLESSEDGKFVSSGSKDCKVKIWKN